MKHSTHWLISGATIVCTDTLTTWLALSTGKTREVNPLMKGLIDTHGYLALFAVKAVVLISVYAVWYLNVGEDGWKKDKMRWMLPRFASTLGVGVTILNSIQYIIIISI